MATSVIKKDISWLLGKVPDFMEFYDSQSNYFINGGYLAGGFLRKVIKNGSVIETIKDGLSAGDIDFFFYSEQHAQEAFEYFTKHVGTFIPRPSTFAPNSVTGFAYEGNGGLRLNSMKKPAVVKFQFIAKSTGSPEEVLNRFDIANCKIATDGKFIWMVDGWEGLEDQKIIRVDNLSGKYFPWRLKKYLGTDYSLWPSNYEQVLAKLLESCNNKSTDMSNVKSILRNKNAIKKEDILLFYEKLGITHENTEPEDYESGTLGQPVDYAIHMFKKRGENV